ncbi:MAG: hypothetical protein AAF548_03650 [Actinomycetota bacterium]
MQLDPDRDHRRDQIAFGHGTHFCAGAGLAFAYLPTFVFRGLTRLHLDVTPEP